MRIIKIIILGEYHSNYASTYYVSISSSTPYKSRLIIKNVAISMNIHSSEVQDEATDSNNLQFVPHLYLCHHNIDIIIIIIIIIMTIIIIIIIIIMIIININMIIIITIIIIITSIMIIILITTIY